MQSDATAYLIAAATLVVAIHLYQQNHELTTKIDTCNTEYRGFKEGVIYGK